MATSIGVVIPWSDCVWTSFGCVGFVPSVGRGCLLELMDISEGEQYQPVGLIQRRRARTASSI